MVDRVLESLLEGLLWTSIACTKLRHDFSQCKNSLKVPVEKMIKEVLKDKLETSCS